MLCLCWYHFGVSLEMEYQGTIEMEVQRLKFVPVRMRWEPFCPTPRATMPVAKATWTSNRSVWRSSPASPHFHRFMCAPVRWGLPPWRPWIPMTRWASTTCQRFQSRSVWLTSVFAIRPLSTWSEWKLWKHIKYIFLGVCMLFIFICIRDKIIKNISKTSISIHQGFIERDIWAFTLLSHCSCESQKYPKAFQKHSKSSTLLQVCILPSVIMPGQNGLYATQDVKKGVPGHK